MELQFSQKRRNWIWFLFWREQQTLWKSNQFINLYRNYLFFPIHCITWNSLGAIWKFLSAKKTKNIFLSLLHSSFRSLFVFHGPRYQYFGKELISNNKRLSTIFIYKDFWRQKESNWKDHLQHLIPNKCFRKNCKLKKHK